MVDHSAIMEVENGVLKLPPGTTPAQVAIRALEVYL
jgi:hypothetical protein